MIQDHTKEIRFSPHVMIVKGFPSHHLSIEPGTVEDAEINGHACKPVLPRRASRGTSRVTRR
jgi:hypothetical protein